MSGPFRQSSFWLKEQNNEAKPSTPPRSPQLGEQPSNSMHMPSTGLDDFLDDEGKDMRIGIVSSSGSDEESEDLPRQWFSWRKLWLFTGPGFLMSIAYLDPGNLESDLQAGAQTGYLLCWVLMWSTILGYSFQMLAAKLGVATGMHLAQHCRQEYPTFARYALWIMTEIAIIGSDVQEVIGSAIAILLLSRGVIPLWAGVLITAVDSFIILLVERLGIRHLEAVFGVLIAIMAGAFGLMAELADVPALKVLEGVLIPRLTRSALQPAVAILGAVIMPHNIYLHSALVHSRKISDSRVSRKREAMAYFSIESALALALSLLINVWVVSVFARGFHGSDNAEIGLENAGFFLGKHFGEHMKYVWAIGLLAAGQSSTMTGTYTGQFVMGGFLNLRIKQWQRVFVTRSVAIVPTLSVALLYRQHRSNAMDVLTQWLNVLQSIQLPFALIPVLVLTSNVRIMGTAFVNTPSRKMFGWIGAMLVLAVNVVLVWESTNGTKWTFSKGVPAAAGITAYVAFVTYLIVGPQRCSSLYARASSGRWREEQQQPLLHNGYHGP